MKPSDFQKTVQCRFESCLKKVVRHIVKDYQQGLKRRKDKEIPFLQFTMPSGLHSVLERPFSEANGRPFLVKRSPLIVC